MTHLCIRCGNVICDGDEIAMAIRGQYKLIRSASAFALHKDVEYLTGTLQHVDCGEALV